MSGCGVPTLITGVVISAAVASHREAAVIVAGA
jgi:hypothetical protein